MRGRGKLGVRRGAQWAQEPSSREKGLRARRRGAGSWGKGLRSLKRGLRERGGRGPQKEGLGVRRESTGRRWGRKGGARTAPGAGLWERWPELGVGVALVIRSHGLGHSAAVRGASPSIPPVRAPRAPTFRTLPALAHGGCRHIARGGGGGGGSRKERRGRELAIAGARAAGARGPARGRGH